MNANTDDRLALFIKLDLLFAANILHYDDAVWNTLFTERSKETFFIIGYAVWNTQS